MSDKDLEPLSPLAQALLGIERRRPDLPEATAGRVLASVAASIAGGVAPQASPGQPASPAQPARSAPVARRVESGTPVSAAKTALSVPARSVAVLVATFVAGAGVGALVRGGPSPREPVAPVHEDRPVQAAPPPPAQDGTPALVSTASAPPPAASQAPPPKKIAAVPSTKTDPASRDSDLAAERALVEQARLALARGQNDAALDAVRAHARAFPRGRLREEREAIAIQALVADGALDQARARAAMFRVTFPDSVFLPAVDLAVGNRP